MTSTSRRVRTVLLTVVAAACGLVGCTSTTLTTPTTPTSSAGTDIDIRILVVDGTLDGLDLGSSKAPVNFSVLPNPEGRFLCAVLSEAETTEVRRALAEQNRTVLSAPHIIAASGSPASVQVGDGQGTSMKVDVTASAGEGGTLLVKFAYSETPWAYEFGKTIFTLKAGDSFVALASAGDSGPGFKGMKYRTILVSPSAVAPAAVAVTR